MTKELEGLNKDGKVFIDKEHFNAVLRAANAFVETNTQITEGGVVVKNDLVKAAENIGNVVISAVEFDLDSVLLDDYEVEVISHLIKV